MEHHTTLHHHPTKKNMEDTGWTSVERGWWVLSQAIESDEGQVNAVEGWWWPNEVVEGDCRARNLSAAIEVTMLVQREYA